jgi:hypothetical protein
MQALKTTLLIVVIMLFVPTSARGQEQRPFGLTIAAPTAIGFIWHISEAIAIRPEFSFTKTSSEFETPIGTTETDTHGFSVGASGLFYVHRWDNLSAYVSPKLLYNRNRSETTQTVLSASSEGIGAGLSIVGSFGTQYTLSRRFAIFGELGLSFSDQESSSSSFAESRAHSWSTRTAVGVTLSF